MTRWFLSPTEHQLRPFLESSGHPYTISSLCEANGVDVIVPSRVGFIGYQRKTLSDLEASVRDGRLARELGQIRSTRVFRHACIVLELDVRRVTNDGRYLDSSFSRVQVRHLGLKAQLSGVLWLESQGLADTIDVIDQSALYIASERATDYYRPNAPRNEWGQRTSRDWSIHLLQSFSDIGPRTAAAIIDTLGLPLAWTVSREQLLTVPGVGPKTADALLKSLRVLQTGSPGT